jgi:hypothetical protein
MVFESTMAIPIPVIVRKSNIDIYTFKIRSRITLHQRGYRQYLLPGDLHGSFHHVALHTISSNFCKNPPSGRKEETYPQICCARDLESAGRVRGDPQDPTSVHADARKFKRGCCVVPSYHSFNQSAIENKRQDREVSCNRQTKIHNTKTNSDAPIPEGGETNQDAPAARQSE